MNAGPLQRLSVSVAAGLLILISAGCRPPGVSDPPAPSDPQELEPGIVRTVDLLRVPGVQLMQRLSDAEIPDSTAPNLRGACGEPIRQPEPFNRLVAVFVGESAALTEAIVEFEEPAARELMKNIKEEVEPGCEPQTVVSEGGQSQTYSQGPLVDIGSLGEDRLGSLATLEIDDQTLHIGSIFIRTGGTMIQALYSSETPVQASTVAGLAQALDAASKRLFEESG